MLMSAQPSDICGIT